MSRTVPSYAVDLLEAAKGVIAAMASGTKQEQTAAQWNMTMAIIHFEKSMPTEHGVVVEEQDESSTAH